MQGSLGNVVQLGGKGDSLVDDTQYSPLVGPTRVRFALRKLKLRVAQRLGWVGVELGVSGRRSDSRSRPGPPGTAFLEVSAS